MELVHTQEHNAHNGNGSAAAAGSPFLGGGYLAEVPTGAQFSDAPAAGLVSPFAGSVVGGGFTEYEDAFEQLFNELEDESFDDAVAALVDEAAALQLSSPWAAESGTGVEQLQAWGARVTDDAHRLLEHFESHFTDRTIESITEAELDLAAAQFVADPATPATEQLFGGLGSKLKAGFKAAASAVGRLAGLGPVTAILKKLVGPLVQRVVNTVLNRLPAALQGPARTLASRIGGQTAASATELATDFDRQFAEALTAPNAAAVDRVLAEAEEAASTPTDDPVGALGVARVRLTEDLRNATAGEAPVVQIEQFIPAVMAAMPLIRTAAKLIGRDRIKGMLATPIAAFIAPYIGSQAAGQLAPHIADAGMKLLQLEHEDAATLGLEALVTTVEETVREVLSLPEESLADDLRVGAEVQEAFADAAARYLPARVLRADLDEAESESEGGGWVMMPRSARPQFRYRAYTRPCRVLLSRPAARAILFEDHETLEERLLDEGVTVWPAEAEVHLYEAIPGTQLGHLSGAETDPISTIWAPTAEFGELTPQAAGFLLRTPGLGRPGSTSMAGSRAMRPGQRFFRVVTRGRPGRRRVRRIALRVDMNGAQPVLRVHLRIGERASHTMAGQLAQQAHTQVIATLRALLGPAARRGIAVRLGRSRALNTPERVPEDRRKAMAEKVAEAMLTAIAKELPAAGATLASAAKDPATGITLTFAFPYPDRAALLGGAPGGPTLTIHPGYRHD
ncbi:hypothetical protein [Mycobacterium sp. URHB0021]|jgi:hypothetical protein